MTTVGCEISSLKRFVGKAVAVILMFSGIRHLGLLSALLIIFLLAVRSSTERKLAELKKELAEQRVILEEIKVQY